MYSKMWAVTYKYLYIEISVEYLEMSLLDSVYILYWCVSVTNRPRFPQTWMLVNACQSRNQKMVSIFKIDCEWL